VLGHAYKNLSRDLGQSEHAVTHGEALPATHFETSQSGARKVKILSAHFTRTRITSQIPVSLEAPTCEGHIPVAPGSHVLLTFWQITLAASTLKLQRPSPEIRFGGPQEPRQEAQLQRYIIEVRSGPWPFHLVCSISFSDRSRDGVPHPGFLPTKVGLGCASEGAIRDHGLLHDRPHPPAMGCNPHHLLN
jgi:hypothetical protein